MKMVGAWGFEPQTPTVSILLYGESTLLESTSTKFPRNISHCIHCFKCMCGTFLCANLCAHSSHAKMSLEKEFSIKTLASKLSPIYICVLLVQKQRF